jgi:hypothetical protein
VAFFSGRHAARTNGPVGEYQRKAINLIARNNLDKRPGVSAKRKEKLSRLENKVLRLVFRPSLGRILTMLSCGEDIKNLERFVDAQRTAFWKILKKYKVSRMAYIHLDTVC